MAPIGTILICVSAARLQQAIALHKTGNLAEAQGIYREILAENPKNPDALHLLGVLARQERRPGEAVELISRAIAINNTTAAFHNNLGNALGDLGRYDEAILAYRDALRLRPGSIESQINLADTLKLAGRLAEAIATYRHLLAAQPNIPEAHYHLAHLLQQAGDLPAAVNSYRDAIRLKPDFAEAFNNLGNIQRQLGKMDEAVEALRSAIRFKPALPHSYINLGALLQILGRLDESIVMSKQAIALAPHSPEGHLNLANAYKDQGRLDDAVAAYRAAIAADPRHAAAHSALVYALYFHDRYDSQTILGEHKQWAAVHAESLTIVHTPHPARDTHSPLRIGFVSPDFNDHPVGRFLLPFFEFHDREQFHFICYSDTVRTDDVTERFKDFSKEWRDCAALSDAALAAQIRADKVDILIDLALHMAGTRLLVFARNPAPVQATYLAYAGTSGISAMDYRITDSYLDPPGNDGFYTEKSIRIPSYWCYQPPPGAPDVAPLPALASKVITFGCFNNFAKVSDSTLQTWGELLRAVPNARLLLHSRPGPHRQRVTDLVGDRVDFIGGQSYAQYLANHARVDIALDPFPYNGGTTTCDALWMGVPVVTLAGQSAVARAGVSILSNVGLPELIASSREQYIEIASKFASDLDKMSRLRLSLRSQMKSSRLCDAQGFARSMEGAFREMWHGRLTRAT